MFRHLIQIRSLVFVLLIVGVIDCQAQPEFPAAIQAKIDSLQYLIVDSGELGEDVPGFSDNIGSYFIALDFDNLQNNVVIIQYEIAAGSVYSNDLGPDEPLSGSAFVEGKECYDPAEGQISFILYLEQIKPSVIAGFSFIYDTIDLRYENEAALVAGNGQYCIEELSKKGGCSPMCSGAENDLFSQNSPLWCLGLCCGISAEFRLPAVRYVDDGRGKFLFENVDQFDFCLSDFRLLYDQRSFTSKSDGAFVLSQRFEIPLYQTGDVNKDGTIDLLDVAGFIECINSGDYNFQCDIDGNLSVDLLDVSGFVDLLVR